MSGKWIHLISIVSALLVIVIFLETIFLHVFFGGPVHEQYVSPSRSQVFARRRNHTLQQCNTSSLSWKSPPDLKHILLDEKRRLLFCVVPKVACTNWKRVLISLETSAPLSEIEHPHSHSFKSLTIDSLDRTANYTKLMFVRHPYERLVSAFENKIHKPFSDYFRSRLLREGMANLSFVAFVDFILSKKPTDLNEHWAPQHLLCLPCQLGYDFVGRYETIKNDSDFILRNVLHSNLTLPRIKSQSPIGRTAMLTPMYMRNLTREARKGIFRLYKKDFELFGYPFPNE